MKYHLIADFYFDAENIEDAFIQASNQIKSKNSFIEGTYKIGNSIEGYSGICGKTGVVGLNNKVCIQAG